jgi:hypothetical protein
MRWTASRINAHSILEYKVRLDKIAVFAPNISIAGFHDVGLAFSIVNRRQKDCSIRQTFAIPRTTLSNSGKAFPSLHSSRLFWDRKVRLLALKSGFALVISPRESFTSQSVICRVICSR